MNMNDSPFRCSDLNEAFSTPYKQQKTLLFLMEARAYFKTFLWEFGSVYSVEYLWGQRRMSHKKAGSPSPLHFTPKVLMGCRSGLRVNPSSSFTPDSSRHVFMDLLCAAGHSRYWKTTFPEPIPQGWKQDTFQPLRLKYWQELTQLFRRSFQPTSSLTLKIH